MNRHEPVPGRLFGMILVLLMAMSCGRDDLPDVPDFEALGFAQALEAVREQVLIVYDEWQEQPLDAELNGRLGMHLSVYNKRAAAAVLYQRARTLAPGEFRWTYYLAFTLVELGRPNEAARMFRDALTIDPGHVEARLQLAELLWRSNDIKACHQVYESITVEFPQRIEGWLGLGKTSNRLGDNVAAVVALRRAQAIGPQIGEVRYALALVLRETGDEAAAARELAVYERTAPNKIRADDSLLQEVSALHAGDVPHMAKAGYLYANGQFGRAAGSFRAALAVNPANAEAWIGLVSSAAGLGRIDAAGDTYHEAIAAGISYARLHLAYGQILLDAGQLDAARVAFGKAIALDSHYAEAYSAMGELEMRSGTSSAAVEQFRLALVARPNERRLRFSLARALNAAGQFDEAVDQLEPLTSDPALDRALTLKELAIAYHGMKRKDQAIDALQRGREVARILNKTQVVDAIDMLLAKWQLESAE